MNSGLLNFFKGMQKRHLLQSVTGRMNHRNCISGPDATSQSTEKRGKGNFHCRSGSLPGPHTYYSAPLCTMQISCSKKCRTGYFFIASWTLNIISAGNTCILWADSAWSINFFIISLLVVPCASKGQSIPISLHIIEGTVNFTPSF